MSDETKPTRKLRAILSADVKGFSLLMADDEALTVKTLKEYRNILSMQVEQYNGRVVDSPGDNILADFASAVDAVECAAEIQKVLKERNANLPDDKRLEFRIGVNIGDVIHDGDRIYGNGVNVAARIEGLAEPGGVCVSRNAYDHIRDKLDLGYEYLGDRSVKNIKHPVRVYKVLMDPADAGKLIGEKPKPVTKKWVWATFVVAAILIFTIVWHVYQKLAQPEFEPASIEDMAYPLPDKPSIAVLPFENMSGDPEQEYFSDGLTDQIISTLTRIRNLFVIARNSTFTYKGKPVKVQKVAEDLGVKYVLEGNVQRTVDRVRITVQLIDAITGHHIWSERYDREQKDIFSIQDDITMEITKAIRVELIEGEQARIWQKKITNNFRAYEKYLQGNRYAEKLKKEESARARSLFEEAITLDPKYAAAYVGLGWTHFNDARHGWVQSRGESLKMAYKYAQKAIEMENTLDAAYVLLGATYTSKFQYENSIAQMERAITLNPNSAQNNSMLAGALGCAGRWEESIGYAEKSLRLAPTPAAWYFWMLGRAYFMTGKNDKAIKIFKKAIYVNPDYLNAHAFLAACYTSLGHQSEAAAEADEVLRINPKFTLESYAKTLPYKNKSDIERYISALHKAGLPEHPLLPLPNKPSIAVLAFNNLSSDPEQEYFSDGIAENIITALSKVGELFVIARNSSFAYKGKPVKVQQISRELGIRYILEGSVQKSGDRVRITAQLIDAKNGQHLRAEDYDRDLQDIFEIQDEITKKIVAALRMELTDGEQARAYTKLYKSLDVYLKQAQANSLWNKGNQESIMRYGQLAQEIIDAEPESPGGYRLLAYYHKALADYMISPAENIQRAFELAQKALSIDESDSFAHTALGFVYSKRREYEKAILSGKRSIELGPNNALAFCLYGSSLADAERFDEAIINLKQAIRLNPFPAYYYYFHLGRCYFNTGRYEDALAEYKKGLQRSPDALIIHVVLAITYAQLDRIDKARVSAEKALEIFPYMSISMLRQNWSYKTQGGLKVTIDAMRKAGFPE